VTTEVARPDRSFWSGRRVLVTGHTGFKGSWLVLWLNAMGAEVHGFSTPPPTEPSLFALAGVANHVRHHEGDVRDAGAVRDAVADARPEVLIHMAAQALVRRSYAEPALTYETNVMGTINVLEAAREVPVVVNVTTDKVYENHGVERGYREDEPLGGHDPYSSSKAGSELVTAAYRSSFGLRVASARAGNVIGGGDFAQDRLVPDAVRAVCSGEALLVRNPDALRPWQHVLNPLSGYLVLAQRLWDDDAAAEAFNFGPADAERRRVREVLDELVRGWDGALRWEQDPGSHPHEAQTLHLDSTRARERLGWAPVWDLGRGLDAVVEWTRAWREGEDVGATTLRQIAEFEEDASL
jgi:CDP-glucose 4,6-dehydratase